MESNRFFTQKGYELQNQEELSASMEDYLEMIYRMLRESQCVRIHALAEQLHVKPSSASKMVASLKEKGYIEFEHYGYLTATKKGQETGDYLLYRHDILHRFLRRLNQSENELEQVEKIEHYLNKNTIENLEKLLQSGALP